MKKLLFICCLGCAMLCAAQSKLKQKTASKTEHAKALLQGAWWGSEYDEHAVFTIDGDEITYIEHFDKFRYKLSGDTFDLITKQPHYKEIIVKLTKDSLVLRELPSKEISRYWRGQ